MFLPHTQYYSTTVAQSITCRKIQCREDRYLFILCLELILNDPLRHLFVKDLPRPSTNNETHLLLKEQFIFYFCWVERVCVKIEANLLCVSKGSTSNVSGRNWVISNLLEKSFDSVIAFGLMETNTSELTDEHITPWLKFANVKMVLNLENIRDECFFFQIVNVFFYSSCQRNVHHRYAIFLSSTHDFSTTRQLGVITSVKDNAQPRGFALGHYF